MLARRAPVDVLRATSRGVGVRFLTGTASAPKTASGGLQPWPRRCVGRTAPQPTVAPGKKRPRYDFARRGAVLPQKTTPAEDCNPIAKAVAERAYDFGTNLTDYSSAVIAAGLVAKSPQGVAVGEIAALAGTGVQALGAAGRFLATGNLTRARYDAIGIAFSFFQSQTKAGSLALGLTAGKAVDSRSQLTPGKDCKR